MTLQKTKPKRPTQARKKQMGQHHRRSKHYVKSYWPYLPIIAILMLGFMGNSWLMRLNHNVLGYATDVNATDLLKDTNVERLRHDQPTLNLNPTLTKAAQAKADDMAKRDYWSHNTPDGQKPWVFIASSGYQYQAAGENLAYGFGTSTQVVNAWMNSAEHRANILNASYRDVGFAVANAANFNGNGPETIVVAFYGEPATTITTVGATVNSPAPKINILGNAQSVSRLQLATGATWSQLAVAVMCGAAIALFVVRHSLAWRKVFVRGEQFVVKHPFFDILLVTAVVFGLLLSRAAGTIM